MADNEETMTASDIDQIIQAERSEAWNDSYLNPVNTATEQARVDKVIHHDTQVDYEN